MVTNVHTTVTALEPGPYQDGCGAVLGLSAWPSQEASEPV
jgi:hypothetical protein